MRLTQWRTPWVLLATSALLIEAAALWFQHGRGLDPCVMCIYERLALLGVATAGLLGAVQPERVVLRVPAYLLWGGAAFWGLSLAREHIAMERDPQLALGCSFAADFPSWLPLDSWLPWLFMPTGYCDDVQWQWLSMSMAEWVGIVFAVYLLILGVVLLVELLGRE